MTTATSTGRREQIVEVATQLFSRHGYSGTSLDDVAAAIGFTKPAIYYWFSRKEDILFEIHDRIVRGSLLRLAEIRQNGESPREQLRTALESHVRTLLGNREANEVFYREQHELSRSRARSIRRRDGEYEAQLREIYAAGVRQGAFRSVDSRVAVGALLGAVNWMYRWYRPGGALDGARVAVSVLDLLERGFLAGD